MTFPQSTAIVQEINRKPLVGLYVATRRMLVCYVVSNQDVSCCTIGTLIALLVMLERLARLLGKGDHWKLKSEIVSKELGLLNATVRLKHLLRQGYELL